MTLRAAEAGWLASGLVLARREFSQSSHLYLRHHQIRDRDLLVRSGRSTAQPADDRTELGGSRNLGDLNVLDRRFRHARVSRVGWILSQHESAALLDGNCSSGTVIERARQHDSNDPGTAGASGAAKQDVDCGTVAVLSRAVAGPQVIVHDHQVAVWWGDDDPALLQFLIRNGHVDRQRPGTLQNGWQCAGTGGGNVQHHQDRGGQVWLECTYECDQALDTAGRGPDNDNVAASNRI